ncbi:MAG: enoyl-CoA hydratase-related protein [Actinophytocola sp.]|uniref:enoyl-CoA hydratase-related protein n=1 Tax=Actinophytocola sp. TaxID=1872138 RepID=UPI003C741292
MAEHMREIDTGTTDLLARVERGVAVLTLNRPERRNALSPEMLTALADVLAVVADADDVRALLLTGAGKAFCAGGDVKAFAARGGEGGGTTVPHEERITRQQALQRATTGRLHAFPKPTVAALPGAAAGAGLGLALACDLRIGQPGTVFATAFGKVGLSGDYGATWLLSRLAGPARARRAMFLGERIDAGTAERWGLLDWVVDAEVLAGFALDTAAELAAGSPESLAAMKQNLLDAEHHDLAAAMDREVPRHLACGVTENHKEAVRAFVEKRPPVFG